MCVRYKYNRSFFSFFFPLHHHPPSFHRPRIVRRQYARWCCRNWRWHCHFEHIMGDRHGLSTSSLLHFNIVPASQLTAWRKSLRPLVAFSLGQSFLFHHSRPCEHSTHQLEIAGMIRERLVDVSLCATGCIPLALTTHPPITPLVTFTSSGPTTNLSSYVSIV